MKILITGGTGFLGRRIVAELAPRHSLRLLVRRGSSRERFPAGVEFAEGDVTDRGSVERALPAATRCCTRRHWSRSWRRASSSSASTSAGLENVLAAAEEAGSVERMVYVSSFMALGPTEGGPGGVLDESAEPRDRVWINDYERTKTLSDRRPGRPSRTALPSTWSTPA